MKPDELIRRCHDLVGDSVGARQVSDAVADADSLISFFQVFRPDGNALRGLFDELDCGAALHQRLEQLFAIAGDDRRPTGGRDAYFIVRNPAVIDPEELDDIAGAWLNGLRTIALSLGIEEVAEMLAPTPTIRILEGIPPKHPKDESEQSHLLQTIQSKVPRMVEQIDAGEFPALLRPAYYFTACDAMLRDYLMWPFYAQATGLDDPLAPYFQIWQHGVKYRIFGESQIDLYLPRQT